MQKRWKFSPFSEARSLSSISASDQELVEIFGVHPIAANLFAQRHITTKNDIEAFFHPDWEKGIHNPFLFRHMEQAVERIFRAIERGEHITVHGDYDADGVTGSAVLITTLRQLVARRYPADIRPAAGVCEINSYIPHRDKEGYGMNPTSVQQIKARGTHLIITVDCGIANVAEIAQAKSLGMDTIVVDHHQFGDELPEGILIHPKLPDETYPFQHLAAVGVAWKLACALCDAARRRGIEIPVGWEKWLLDLVSIATVTDMVPLVGENRVLETFGLTVLNKTRRPGLRALIECAGYALGELDAESIAFGLGPRINAAGRMDHASLALKLLLADQQEEAQELALQLETHNRSRQSTMLKMMEEADCQQQRVASAPISIVWSETWSPALVGLVAGKYLDRMGKPSIAIGKHGDRWIGSGRSFATYDITQAVKTAGEGILTHYGGHVQACGFSFSKDEYVTIFTQRLIEHASSHLREDECVPALEIDAEVELDAINWNLIETLEKFEPFGEGNKKPLFMTRALEVLACNLVGNQKNHLRCHLRASSGRTEKFIGFKLGNRAEELRAGTVVDVVYGVGVNIWNGRKEIQCSLVDMRRVV